MRPHRRAAARAAAVLLWAAANAQAQAADGPANWTYEAVAATPRWTEFVAKLTADYIEPVAADTLGPRCRDELAARPVAASGDGAGACIEAVLRSLDEFSQYLAPHTYAELKSMQSSFVGIGVEIAKDAGQPLRIVAPIPDGPGDRAGIRAGDEIVSADGVDLRPLSMQETVRLLRNEAGTTLKLTLLRKGEPQPIRLDVVRAEVRGTTVRTRMLTDEAAYVHIARLDMHSGYDLATKLLPLRSASGAAPTAIVLDLRGNEGGLLDALESIGWFLAPAEEPVVTMLQRGEPTTLFALRPRRWATERQPHPRDLEARPWTQAAALVVLVDRKTASGAEALAQFLREARQARLLGTVTAGATNVRSFITLGDDAAVTLTTGRLVSPTRVDWSAGLVPDLPLEPQVPLVPRDGYGGAGDAWVQRALAELAGTQPAKGR